MAITKLDRSYLFYSILHLLCFVFGVAICGIYGSDIQFARNNGNGVDSKWVYAVVVGALSAVTCVIYFIPMVLAKASLFMTIWDTVLFILWITLFGIFGKMYIHADAAGNRDIERMKNAVWVDLVGALLWLIAALATGLYWFKHRGKGTTRTRWAGRVGV